MVRRGEIAATGAAGRAGASLSYHAVQAGAIGIAYTTCPTHRPDLWAHTDPIGPKRVLAGRCRAIEAGRGPVTEPNRSHRACAEISVGSRLAGVALGASQMVEKRPAV